MKKIIALILALSLVCTWMSACSDEGSEGMGTSDELTESFSDSDTSPAEKTESSEQESRIGIVDSYEDDTLSLTCALSDDNKTCNLEYTFKNKYDIYNNAMIMQILSTDTLKEQIQLSDETIDTFICTFSDEDGEIFSLKLTVTDGEISDYTEPSVLRSEYDSILSGLDYENKIELISAIADENVSDDTNLSFNFFPVDVQIKNLTDESIKSAVYLNVECEDGQFITIDGVLTADGQSTNRLIVVLDDEQSEFLAEHKYKDCEIAAAVFA